MRSGRAVALLATGLLCAIALTGCVTTELPAGAAPTAQPSATRIVVPTDSAGNYIKSPDLAATRVPIPGSSCLNVRMTGDSSPQTISQAAAKSQVILVGTFTGFGAVRWNTPGGIRPTNSQFRSSSAMLVRPVSIKLGSMVRGLDSSAQHAITLGGELGCDSIVVDNTPNLAVGSRYVFFLFSVLDSAQKPSDDLLVIEAWPVSSTDVVETDQDGSVPLSQLLTIVSGTPLLSTAP